MNNRWTLPRRLRVGFLTALVLIALSPAYASISHTAKIALLTSTHLGQEDPPGANISFEDLIAERDGQGLLPNHDWVPLWRLEFVWSSDMDPAPRFMEDIDFIIRPDPADGRSYDRLDFIEESDLLEFAIFLEGGPVDERGTLNDDDNLLFTFNADGSNNVPGLDIRRTLAELDDGNLPATDPLNDPDEDAGTISGDLIPPINSIFILYSLNFDFFTIPDFAGLVSSNPDIPNSYICAVRTSNTWHNGITLGYDVLFARALALGLSPILNFPAPITFPGDGNRDVNNDGINDVIFFPVNDMGEPIDSYSPDFFGDDPETLNPEVAYSSSFAVYDFSGGPVNEDQNVFFANWNHRITRQTSTAEWVRPRFDQLGTPFDFVLNQFIQLEEIIPLDDWIPLLGINIHSTAPPDLAFGLRTHNPWSIGDPAVEQADLQEVNVVVTDVGADPFGPPGNGGFNPNDALERMTVTFTEQGDDASTAVGDDFTFNGLWVFHDTDGDGIFTKPQQQTNQIATITDFPMLPAGLLANADLPVWEYVPFPPGGGDPWWKMKVEMSGGARRDDFAGDTRGFIEGVPDGDNTPGLPRFATTGNPLDYYVVVRPDSGFGDTNGLVGDGTGMLPGADFKAFIEPRRIDAVTQNFEGGIYADSMIPANFATNQFTNSTAQWQNSALWGPIEPWWPQRTHRSYNTKSRRAVFEVHDLVMSYDGNLQGGLPTFIPNFDFAFLDNLFGVGFDPTFFIQSTFDIWLDPFAFLQLQFADRHTVAVIDWTVFNLGQGPHYPFEHAPFFNPTDAAPNGPRSLVFPNPPPQPSTPDFSTWPAMLNPGEYPRLSNWAPDDRRARFHRQRIDSQSTATALLGFNVVGSNDIHVNDTNFLRLSEITVAFWGPEFAPTDLQPLDPDGLDDDSGVALWRGIEDQNGDGVADGNGVVPLQPTFLQIRDEMVSTVVELDNLQWADFPELIDLDGDGVADDMNGDAVVDNMDRAWVLRLRPRRQIVLPPQDFITADNPNLTGDDPLPFNFAQEALSGDDLFLMVRTSDTISRLEQFRAVVPATLPERTGAQQTGNLRFLPAEFSAHSAAAKFNIEESIEQDFIGHDMMEANVPAKVVNLAAADTRIQPNGPATALLGIDLATNMPENTLMTGDDGVGGPSSFTLLNKQLTPGEFAGRWLVDSGFETFEILDNSNNIFTLRSGQPRDGAFRIVKDPTFFEQCIVEFYNVTNQDPLDPNPQQPGDEFDILTDLLPLDIDQTVSGVALYRDNDFHPQNRNGQFDAGIDIPLQLDERPVLVGQAGEPDTQIRFVFSTPGTDDVPIPMAEQPRNRQWVQDTFGITDSDPNTGPDFFVVVRPSGDIEEGDDFAAGIVGWGPNTPTEPDPDTFTSPLPPELGVGEANKFRAFPFGSRALGFITFLEEPKTGYFMEGTRARAFPDNSGFDWFRTHSIQQFRSVRVVGDRIRQNPAGVRIDSVSADRIPAVIMPGESFNLVIRGENFGTAPTVSISDYNVEIEEARDDAISVSLTNRSGIVPSEPIIILVRNTNNGTEQSRGDLLRLTSSSETPPKINQIAPDRGAPGDFPVTISGENFNPVSTIEVLFGQVRMPIRSVSTAGDRIVVNFPLGGFSETGPLDVTVRNLNGLGQVMAEDTVVSGFTFVNPPAIAFPCFIATAAYGSPLADELHIFHRFRDNALLSNPAGAAFVDAYYRVSPPIAGAVAQSPILATVVRALLTVVAWLLAAPMMFMIFAMALVFTLALSVRRRRGKRRRAHAA